MKSMRHFEDFAKSLRSMLHSVIDEVGIAGAIKGAPEIELAGSSFIANRARRGTCPVDSGTVKNLVRVQAVLEARDGGNDLENRARRIGSADGAIELRRQHFVVEPVLFSGRKRSMSRDEFVWIKRRSRRDGQDIAVSRVHDHGCAACYV